MFFARLSVILAVLVLFPAFVQGRTLESHTLPNGLKVVLVAEPKAPTVTIQIWYRVGSRNEVSGKTGLAHLTEHMMFKGTKRHGKGEFSRQIAEAGGNENAFTGRDYTAYFENLAADRLDLALELEADRMTGLLLDPKEFLLERDVVMEERRLRTDDDPQSVVIEQMYAQAFLMHPYRSPIIGWMVDLENLSHEDSARFYRTYYVPNNATLVVVGDIDPRKVLSVIKKTFGRVPKGKPVPVVHAAEPPQTGERRLIVKKEAQLPFVFLGFRAVNHRSPDAYPLTVLSNLLSSGKSSRLYQGLVYSKKIALDAGGEYDPLSTDSDLFYFYGVPQPGSSIETLEAALYEEVDRLKREPVSDRELAKVKNQIEAEFILGQDSNFFTAMEIGRAETVGAGMDYVHSFVEKIRAVTAEDVARVAKNYLIVDRRTVGILTPLPPNAGESP